MGFNGATAMKPWKSNPAGKPMLSSSVLQWGHGDEAVEEVLKPCPAKTSSEASMGPRR